MGLVLRTADDRTQQRQELDALRIASVLRLGHVADLSDVLGHHDGAVAADEDRLGVLRRERLAGLGCARLQDQRRALPARLADVWAGHFEVLALVVDLADARGLGVYAALAVEHHGVGPPGGFPEFVGDFDVFLGDGVAVVVLGWVRTCSGSGCMYTYVWLVGMPHVTGCRVEIAGDDLLN